jgi:hypothetical protein
MRKLFILISLFFYCTGVFGQNSYVQVSGEVGLEVYLNNVFRCTTKADIGGCIIENVPVGKNVIRVVKNGFVPFEETIVVKAGEVLLYKVKEFSKNTVFVSESGNTEVTNRKQALETGTLIVQSVPIGIKITIPDVENLTNKEKTQDVWKAENFLVGTHTVIFQFNNKRIERQFLIMNKRETHLFVNMLTGEVKTSNKIEEKYREENQRNVIHDLESKCKFKMGLLLDDYLAFNPAARVLLSYPTGNKISGRFKKFSMPYSLRKTNYPCVTEITELENFKIDIINIRYTTMLTQNKVDALDYYQQVLAKYKDEFDPSTFRYTDNGNTKELFIIGGKLDNKRIYFTFKSYDDGWNEVYYDFMN